MRSRTSAAVLLAVLPMLLVAACEAGVARQTSPLREPIRISEELRIQIQDEAAAALLSDADVPGWLSSTDGIDAVGVTLQQACGAALPSDSNIIYDEIGQKWRRGKPRPSLDEEVIGYADPVGPAAVDQARAALTCTRYQAPIIDEGTLINVQAFSVAGLGLSSAGYCEQSSDAQASRCVLMVGVGHLACRVRSTWDTEVDAKRTIVDLAPTVARKCASAATDPPSPTSSSSSKLFISPPATS